MNKSSTIAEPLEGARHRRDNLSYESIDLNDLVPKNVSPKQESFLANEELISSQVAGRLNASSISETEVEDLLNKRKRLIEKKYSEGLTVFERYELEYYRWSLDRIDDARHGASIEALEASVNRFKKLILEVSELKHELEMFRMSPPK